MVTIEQVKLLESRVIKTIEFVDHVTEENSLLKSKLESCQKRIDELEVLIQRFKEDQAKIEDGIVSALDRLNKFEDDIRSDDAKSKSESVTVKRDSKNNESAASKKSSEAVIEEGFVLKEKPYNPDIEEDENGDSKEELEIF
ncbi:MAG: hypothetical protein Pg6A_13840 [Termitinemataceae bacterium]|nr:MAG: hypothetical protein Pg6A_13840 [Termitinemataceae bacterium]